MARKKGTQHKKQVDTFSDDFRVEPEITKRGVFLQQFDIMLTFEKDNDTPLISLEEYTRLIIDGLLDRYGKINVRINWFSKDLTIHAPTIPEGAIIAEDA